MRGRCRLLFVAAVLLVSMALVSCRPYSEAFAPGRDPLTWIRAGDSWLAATAPDGSDTVTVLTLPDSSDKPQVDRRRVPGAKAIDAGIIHGERGPMLYLAGGYATDEGFKRGIRFEPWPPDGDHQFLELPIFQWATAVSAGGSIWAAVRSQVSATASLTVLRDSHLVFEYEIEGELGDVGLLSNDGQLLIWWRERGRSDRAQIVVCQLAVDGTGEPEELYRAEDGYFAAVGHGYYGNTLGLGAIDDVNNPGAAYVDNGTFYLIYEQIVTNLSIALPSAAIQALVIPLREPSQARAATLEKLKPGFFFLHATPFHEDADRRILWLAEGLKGAGFANSVYSASFDESSLSFSDQRRESSTTRFIRLPAVLARGGDLSRVWLEDVPSGGGARAAVAPNQDSPIVDRGNSMETIVTMVLTAVAAALYAAFAATVLNPGNAIAAFVGFRLLFALRPAAALDRRRIVLFVTLALHAGLYGLFPLTIDPVYPSYGAWIAYALVSAGLLSALIPSRLLRTPNAFFAAWWMGTYLSIALGAYPPVFSWVREFGIFNL